MREARYAVGSSTIVLKAGDITAEEVDAIVNAANSRLAGGGGVDGAIHRAGGPAIAAECRRVIAEIGRLETGKAVATGAGNLRARWVIHAVGPVYRDGRSGERELLASAYRESLRLAVRLGARTVAFPSISTGAYRYPLREAAAVALAALGEELAALDEAVEVRIVLFGEDALRAFVDEANARFSVGA